MSEITTIGLDLAKNVFQVHGADAAGHPVLRKKLRRSQLFEFFSNSVTVHLIGGSRGCGALGADIDLEIR